MTQSETSRQYKIKGISIDSTDELDYANVDFKIVNVALTHSEISDSVKYNLCKIDLLVV